MKKNLLVAFLLGKALLSFGQWSNNSATNTPVYVGAGDQTYTGSVADGSGGVLISWESDTETAPNSFKTTPYIQKLSSAGVKQWNTNGIKVSDAAVSSSNSYMVSDNAGGAIIAWEEAGASNSANIYAQRIDASGNRLWGNNGIAVTSGTGSQSMGAILADGSGGLMVSWVDETNPAASKVYVQRLNSSGVKQWTSTGVLVSDNTGNNSGGYIFSDTAGGFVIVWEEEIEPTTENFEGTKLYWQKLTSAGARQTPSNTLIFNFPVSNTAYTYVVGASPDGTGGIYVGISAENDNSASLYLQHILSNGSKAFGSTQIGMEIDASVGTLVSGTGFSFVNYSIAVAGDNNGGVVLGWTDTRSGKKGYYGQRVNSAGTKLWGTTDLTLAPDEVSPSGLTNIVTNNEGNFVFNISKGPSDLSQISLYAQKVSPAGALQYGTNGVAVATSAGFKYGEMVATSDKVVFLFSDTRAGDTGTMTDVYAQSIFSNGTLPVHFLDFRAAYSKGKTDLNWTTASENNNAYFVVERSENGEEFSSISSIKGAGTSSQLNTYNFVDAEALSSKGVLYYCIKQVDSDGKSGYSDIQSVKVPVLNTVAAITYFPNPVKDKLVVDFNKSTDAILAYSLQDISGKVIQSSTGTTNSGRFQINMETLSPGVYVLNIQSEGKTFKEKVVKN